MWEILDKIDVILGIVTFLTTSYTAYLLRHRTRGWRVLVYKEGSLLMDRPVGAEKAARILDDPSELSVYLKGVVSPFAWLNADLIEEGQAIGLLTIDRNVRRYVINLDKNPPAPPRLR